MPAGRNVELIGALETQKDMTRIARELHGGPMVRAIQRSTLRVQATARREAAVDTGLHRANITPDVRTVGNTIVGIVGSNLEYSPFAVNGRKPGKFPPVSAIQEWVHRKGLAARFSVTTKRRLRPRAGSRARGAEESRERSIAFLIARKIAKKGAKGDQSLWKGFDQNVTLIQADLLAAVDEILGGQR